MVRYILGLGLLLLLTSVSWAQSNNHLRVAALEWCPQVCFNHSREGYMVDILRAFAKQQGLTLSIIHSPWVRGIRSVEKGQFDALLPPSKKEAPSLIYPQQPISSQRVCFFAREASQWQFTGVKSLQEVANILVPKGMSLIGVQDYMEQHPERFPSIPVIKESRLVNILLKQRTEAIAYDERSMQQYLQQAKLTEEVKQVGCLVKEDIYLAFSPKQPHRYVVLAEKFDDFLLHIKASGWFQQLLDSYAVTLPSD